ncbi:uncharacterized protein ASPGLDRAFT_145538 [Aspergillus glaucus CBS 516.65]|uniref:Uncharacterized protein n=1 Tax=Aspergillus glaucus CBS 516.65 TaxID=1160497 RepID=A0A1L9VSF1_ASPGL|nr:hypothetical protein ASPGLDRAFT_145538 [Aspergillus glaucus CBS 516.65]OJJ86820.1 hypothetical protein ASPGLDRAFT_145538 [Aspergillus glaucus CBS 516.65]
MVKNQLSDFSIPVTLSLTPLSYLLLFSTLLRFTLLSSSLSFFFNIFPFIF